MKSKLTKLTLSIILTLTITSLAVVLTLVCKPLYYLDIHALHIPETTGCTISEIKANYNAVIDYCLSFGNAPLEFPTFPMSEGGRIHFEEVKNIFNLFKYMVIGGTLASTAGILWMRRKHCYGYLKLTAILTVALPAIIGAAVALNWDRTFVTFHEIAFNNDYWLFDPATDPVINILPDLYFLHCAVMILALVILGSILCAWAYRAEKGKTTNNTNKKELISGKTDLNISSSYFKVWTIGRASYALIIVTSLFEMRFRKSITE